MLKKVVDGIEVECSAEEEAAIRAEWAENDEQQRLAAIAKADTFSALDTAIQAKDTDAALRAIKELLATRNG